MKGCDYMDNRNNIDCGYKRALEIIEKANRNRPSAGCCFPTSSTGTPEFCSNITL